MKKMEAAIAEARRLKAEKQAEEDRKEQAAAMKKMGAAIAEARRIKAEMEAQEAAAKRKQEEEGGTIKKSLG
jgi:hypothetical protein